MPRLNTSETKAGPTVEFVVSIPIDLMNAMYFTHLVAEADGIEGWPVEVRKQMAPDLLQELDFLYSFPKGQPGVMGQLGDTLWAHPETWESVDALVDYVRKMPLGVGDSAANSGVQGLAFYATCSPFGGSEKPYVNVDARETLRKELEKAESPVSQLLAVYDNPEELRNRIVRLIERFNEEYYREEVPNRLPSLERSAAEHRFRPVEDVAELAAQLAGRPRSCLFDICEGPYTTYYFSPSLDVAPYNSCSVLGDIHGLIYPCEPRFIHGTADADETARMARIYKALSDEGRLRIISLLREREMYAREIVERIGLHQSVVSRHLTFLNAVGILRVRKVNNMKFYSINTEMHDELSRTLEMFAPAAELSPKGNAR
jgi:DNA-binding transcriptional ArsR family regulator